MSKILSVGTAVPAHRHEQKNIFDFMQRVYAPDEAERRKLSFLYRQSGIHTRYSVVPDYSLPADKWQFYPPTENLEPFPSLEQRMSWFGRYAADLSKNAINNCLSQTSHTHISHLITVSCTGMSAPGLDLELVEALQLDAAVQRYSVNFMGCYAAIHALKMADAFCKADPASNVLIVCTELCTLHFQKESSVDSITSSMLFGDGSAALLVAGDHHPQHGLRIDGFYSNIALKGKKDMAWQLSGTGFLMTLSSYIPDLIAEDFSRLTNDALSRAHLTPADISHWCIHPGGRKILEAVHQSLGFTNGQLGHCYDILREFGNMSSPTVLFVLERIASAVKEKEEKIFGAAFGPGLTMETFILSS